MEKQDKRGKLRTNPCVGLSGIQGIWNIRTREKNEGREKEEETKKL